MVAARDGRVMRDRLETQEEADIRELARIPQKDSIGEIPMLCSDP